MKAPAIVFALALGTIAVTSLAQDSDIVEPPGDQEEATVTNPKESFVEVDTSDNSRSDKLSDNVMGSPPTLQGNAAEDAPSSFWHPEPQLTIRDYLPFLGFFFGAVMGFGGIVYSAKKTREREEELSRNDTKALATALASEVFMLTSLCRTWNNRITTLVLKGGQLHEDAVEHMRNPRPLLYEKNAGKIGNLNRVTRGTVEEVVEFYSRFYRLDKHIDTAPQRLKINQNRETYELMAHYRNVTAFGLEAIAYLKLVAKGDSDHGRDKLDQAVTECIGKLEEDGGMIFEVAQKLGQQPVITMIWENGKGVIKEQEVEETEEH